MSTAGPSGAREADERSARDAREYARRLRALPAGQVLGDFLFSLLNAAQVKLGRRDARLLIDVTAVAHEHARPYLPGELSSQIDQALGQLRMGQVRAEGQASQQGQPEENDLDQAPAPARRVRNSPQPVNVGLTGRSGDRTGHAMRDGGDRRGAEGSPVTRRVLLAAGGAVLLTSAAAAVAADARAHGAGTQPRPAAGGAAGPARARASARPGPDRARPATSAAARQHPELTQHAARPPRREQPRLAYGEPMYTVADGPKIVALTIDDGPSPVYTPQILKVLRRYGVTASFSMIGRNAAAFPGVAREVAAAGHMIVNHTWNHYNLRSMPAAAVRDEISRATDAIHAATGERPGMFRAPYGVWPPAVFSCCAQAGLTPLAWSVDPRDWSRPGIRAIIRDIESDTRTGSIILEHDGGGNRSQTVAALKIWLPRLLEAGYRFTTP